MRVIGCATKAAAIPSTCKVKRTTEEGGSDGGVSRRWERGEMGAAVFTKRESKSRSKLFKQKTLNPRADTSLRHTGPALTPQQERRGVSLYALTSAEADPGEANPAGVEADAFNPFPQLGKWRRMASRGERGEDLCFPGEPPGVPGVDKTSEVTG